MALAHVQTVKANGGGSAVLSCTTAGITTTAGNLLVAVTGGWKTGAAQLHTVTDSKGNTWVEVANSPVSPTAANTRLHLFYAKNCLGGASHTFTSTVGATALMSLFVMEISGADTAAPYDTGAGTIGNSTTPSSGVTGTRAQADEIIIGAVGTGDNVNSGTMTAGSGFTIPTNGSEISFNNYVSAIEYQIKSSAGTDAATFTISSDFWGCIAATFKAAAAANPIFNKSIFARQAVKRASSY